MGWLNFILFGAGFFAFPLVEFIFDFGRNSDLPIYDIAKFNVGQPGDIVIHRLNALDTYVVGMKRYKITPQEVSDLETGLYVAGYAPKIRSELTKAFVYGRLRYKGVKLVLDKKA